MKILSLDTAGSKISVAVSDGKDLAGQRLAEEKNQNVEVLFLYIEDLFKEFSLSYDKIDVISANIGPGSFTGLRAGLAAVQGLCMVKGINFMPVNAMEVFFIKSKYVLNCAEDTEISVLQDAGHEEFFSQSFSLKSLAIREAALISKEEVLQLSNDNKVIFCRKDLDILKYVKSEKNIFYASDQEIRAHDIALAAIEKIKSGFPFEKVRPLYMRNPNAKIKNKKVASC